MRLLQHNEKLPDNFETIKAWSKHTDIKQFLGLINETYQKAAVYQINQIQELIQAQLEKFIANQSSGPKEELKSAFDAIDFHVELQNNNFAVLPHNLFTLVIMNGEYAPPSKVEPLGRHTTDQFTYIFDPLAQVHHVIPNNLTLHTLDGIQYRTINSDLAEKE